MPCLQYGTVNSFTVPGISNYGLVVWLPQNSVQSSRYPFGVNRKPRISMYFQFNQLEFLKVCVMCFAAKVEMHSSIMSKYKFIISPGIFSKEKKKSEASRHHVKQPKITAVMDELEERKKSEC